MSNMGGGTPLQAGTDLEDTEIILKHVVLFFFWKKMEDYFSALSMGDCNVGESGDIFMFLSVSTILAEKDGVSQPVAPRLLGK